MKYACLFILTFMMVGCTSWRETYDAKFAARQAASKERAAQSWKARNERRAIVPIIHPAVKPAPDYRATAKMQVQVFFRSYLRDSESAKFDWGGWDRVAWKERRLSLAGSGEPLEYVDVEGFRLIVLINAKNAFGGYVGWETYHFLFMDDGRLSEVREWADGSQRVGDSAAASIVRGLH